MNAGLWTGALAPVAATLAVNRLTSSDGSEKVGGPFTREIARTRKRLKAGQRPKTKAGRWMMAQAIRSLRAKARHFGERK